MVVGTEGWRGSVEAGRGRRRVGLSEDYGFGEWVVGVWGWVWSLGGCDHSGSLEISINLRPAR